MIRILVIFGFIVGLVLGAAHFKRKWDRSVALPRIETLVNVSEEDRLDMMKLYEKRMQLLLQWEQTMKSTKRLPPAAYQLPDTLHHPRDHWDLRSPEDRRQFDAFQTAVSNAISNYLANPETRALLPADLKRTEEQILERRRAYQATATEANQMMEKHGVDRARVPVFETQPRMSEPVRNPSPTRR